MTNTLTQSAKWYNPFYIEGRQVKNIYFYNESGIVCETGRGWFGNNNGMGSMYIGETIRKAKFNPAAKCNFWIPVAAESYETDKCCNVYLYVDGKDITCERLPDTQSDGVCKAWIDHWQHFAVNIHGIKKQIEKYTGNEKTAFGRKVDKMEKTFKDMGIRIDSYEVMKLLESFNVSKKRKEV